MWKSIGGALSFSLVLAACDGERKLDGEPEDLSAVNDREGEACEIRGEERACGENDAGVQFCSGDEEETAAAWGVCLTELECEPGETESCSEGAGWRSCGLDDGEPAWSVCFEEEGEDTPLVVVFPGDEIAYQAAGGASFSLGGECLTHDWPTATTPWLALDRDHNGSIDGGHELFGSGTVLGSGLRAEHGFAALAELDANGDGEITPADPRFAELVLWSDHDGDRRSTHWEHASLASHGIVAIPVAFERARECDARGNCGVERASIELRRGEATLAAEIVDVHLACQ